MILLSFDTEEFDVPREHGVDFSLEEGMKVSVVGTNRILDILHWQLCKTGTRGHGAHKKRRTRGGLSWC